MDLRSGRRLGSLPTPVPRRSGRPPGFPDGDGSDSDRISALPDEMLLQILVRLRCARAAAHTSGLSRRWRGLWRYLPELSFRDMSADALDAALDQVAGSSLSFLEVHIPEENRVTDPARVSALLRAAARLAPADLVFSVTGDEKDLDIPIEIPCFERATSVKLHMADMHLIPPAGGVEFPLLEKLSVTCCRIDTAELAVRCPRLRVFQIQVSPSEDIGAMRVKVHSPTTEELKVIVHGVDVDGLDIMAPVLKRFTLMVQIAADFTVSFSAPMVENISWSVWYKQKNVRFGNMWRMSYMCLQTKESVGVLRMCISPNFQGWMLPARTFAQEIAPLPAFSVLELNIKSKNHVVGALVSHLLRICSTIRRLEVDIQKYWDGEEETCSPNCPCGQPQNWRDAVISLTALKEAEVTGFGETDHEVDLLKLLFRCAPLMKSLTVELAPESLRTGKDCEEIHSIFEANPHVKCSVRRSPSEDQAGSG